MAEKIPIDLTILSGDKAMVGTGKGIPLNEAEKAFSLAAYNYPVIVDEGRLKPLQIK